MKPRLSDIIWFVVVVRLSFYGAGVKQGQFNLCKGSIVSKVMKITCNKCYIKYKPLPKLFPDSRDFLVNLS